MNYLFLTNVVTNGQMLAILGMLFALMSIIAFLLIIIFIIQIFARWRVFAKMGIPSWKCLIPIYSDYCLWKGVWTTSMFFVDLLLSFVFVIGETYCQNYLAKNGNNITTILYIILILLLVIAIILIVIQVNFVGKYSAAFGHGPLFAVGMFFFPSIFELIIGFGSSQYVGNTSE